MAYVGPPFAHDVLVSYAHGDADQDGVGLLKRWTHALVRELKNEISGTDPEFGSVDIFFDEHLDPTFQLTDQLQQKVSSSAILLVVMCKYYLQSAWCKREVGSFGQDGGERQEEQGRCFLLRATEADTAKWPEFLKVSQGEPLPGFFFHSRLEGSR